VAQTSAATSETANCGSNTDGATSSTGDTGSGSGFVKLKENTPIPMGSSLDTTKGTAVRHLLAETGLQRALYAGDDTTDLNGFDALDGLEVAVRVAVASPEGPADLARRADVVVASPAAFLDLLRGL